MTDTCDTCGRERPASDSETNSNEAELIIQAVGYCPDCERVAD